MKIAIIGYGNIAPYYIHSLESKTNEIIICSRKNPVNIVGSFKYVSNYKDELLKEADLIVIATPPNLHYEMAIYFLNLGKKVILEKPAVISQDELSKLTYNRNLYFAYHSAFNPLIEVVKEYLDISTIKNVDVEYKEDVFHYHPDKNNWIFKQEYSGGGCLIDSGINIFSILYQFVSELYYENGELYKKSLGVEDSLNINLTTKDSIKVNINMDWLSKKEVRQIIFKANTIIKIDLASNVIIVDNKQVNSLTKINKIDLQSEYDRLIEDALNYFQTGNTKLSFSPILPLKTVLDVYSKCN